MRVQLLGQEDPLEEEWKPSPVFLPGESHGKRSLAGYSTWGCKELDITEWLSTHTHLHITISNSSRSLFFSDLIRLVVNTVFGSQGRTGEKSSKNLHFVNTFVKVVKHVLR